MLNIKCMFSFHDWSYQFDMGRDSVVSPPGSIGIMYYSNTKIKCSKCGLVKDASKSEHHKLPEIIFFRS